MCPRTVLSPLQGHTHRFPCGMYQGEHRDYQSDTLSRNLIVSSAVVKMFTSYRLITSRFSFTFRSFAYAASTLKFLARRSIYFYGFRRREHCPSPIRLQYLLSSSAPCRCNAASLSLRCSSHMAVIDQTAHSFCVQTPCDDHSDLGTICFFCLFDGLVIKFPHPVLYVLQLPDSRVLRLS